VSFENLGVTGVPLGTSRLRLNSEFDWSLIAQSMVMGLS